MICQLRWIEIKAGTTAAIETTPSKGAASANKKRRPITPATSSSKKPPAGTTTPTTASRPHQAKPSPWAAPPSERRQPLLKAGGTPKTKIPAKPAAVTVSASSSRAPVTPKIVKTKATGAGRGVGGITSSSPCQSYARSRTSKSKIVEGGRKGSAQDGSEGTAEEGRSSGGILPPR